MKVRVYDSFTDTYFKSEVYAKINTGWYEKQLVIVPSDDGAYIKFFDYLDKNIKPANVLINTIISDIPTEWIFQRSSSVDRQLTNFQELLNSNIRFFEFIGYPWILTDESVMIELLNGNSIPLEGSIFENKVCHSEVVGWNYIESQKDADFILEQASGFHDTILKELNYISGGYVRKDNSMCPIDAIRKVTMLFDSQWCAPIEMVFEGVTALNLRPAEDNQLANIFGASLYVQNSSVFFCDDSIEKIDEAYQGTWILAYSLRWRFVQ